MSITGYDLDEQGPPAGICGWCWRSSWSVGISPITGANVPLHVTCAVQMQIIRGRLLRGIQPNPNDLHLTVAWKRYFRLKRVECRRALEDRETARFQLDHGIFT